MKQIKKSYPLLKHERQNDICQSERNAAEQRIFYSTSQIPKLLFWKMSIIILLTVFISCTGKKTGSEEEIKSIPEVKVVKPSHQKMADYLTFNGNTVFLSYEVIRATFSGYIEKINKNIGDRVINGENIFFIRTKESRAIDTTNQLLTDVKFKGLVKISAKTEGTFIKIFYHQGDYVMDGEQLALIAAPQSLRIILNVPFKFMNQVRNTSDFIITLPDGKKLDAKLGNIMPSVDQITQTQTVILFWH